MPRVGNVFSLLSGSKGTPNTTIQSAPYNAQLDDFVQDANLARPITAGGTGATSPSGARTALGLVPGTDIQAFDAGLLSIAGLTTAANLMLYTTAPDVYASTALTPFARSFLDDTDAAAVRTTLGLGAISVLDSVSDANWSGADLSVANGGTGASTAAAAAANLGLGNVNNTSDANKPVSSAQQLALNNKFDKTGGDIAGPVTVTAVGLSIKLQYPNVKYWEIVVTNNKDLLFQDGIGGQDHVYFSANGAIWTQQLGDLNTRINTQALGFANDRVANLATRMVSRGSTGATIDGEVPSGAVVTGYTRQAGGSGQVSSLYYRYFQMYDPVRGWVGAAFA